MSDASCRGRGFPHPRGCVLRSPYNVRDDQKESDPSFSETLRVQETEPHSCNKGGAGKVCACCVGKWRWRLEAHDFCHKEDRSCSICKSAAAEYIQCPGRRHGAGNCVQWRFKVSWDWTPHQEQEEEVSGSRGQLPDVREGCSHLLTCQAAWLLDRALRIGHFRKTNSACLSFVLLLPLLLFHVGTNSTARGSLSHTKWGYIAVEPGVKGSGTRWFSSWSCQ